MTRRPQAAPGVATRSVVSLKPKLIKGLTLVLNGACGFLSHNNVVPQQRLQVGLMALWIEDDAHAACS